MRSAPARVLPCQGCRQRKDLTVSVKDGNGPGQLSVISKHSAEAFCVSVAADRAGWCGSPSRRSADEDGAKCPADKGLRRERPAGVATLLARIPETRCETRLADRSFGAQTEYFNMPET